MEKGRILFIDDELGPYEKEPNGNYMWYYYQALIDKRYEVKGIMGPDAALSELDSRADQYDLIILDIMMSPEETYRHENTQKGLRTGIFLLKTLQQKYPDLPVFVLTNVQAPEVLTQVGSFRNVKLVATKDIYPPFDLAAKIQEL